MSPLARVRDSRFALRLAVTLLVTTAAIGAAQYLLAGRALTDRVLEQELTGLRGDAQVLSGLYDTTTADPYAEARPLLAHIASRPGVRGSMLVGPGGDLVGEGAPRHRPAAGATAVDMAPGGGAMAGDMTAMRGEADRQVRALPESVRKVLTGGDAQAERSADGAETFYAVPLDLDGQRHVLAVTRSSAPLAAQVATVRRVLLSTLAVGAALALPLFFLVGGRSLTARHRRAVDSAVRDGLTGLQNHRSFHEDLADHVSDPRLRRTLTLALVDLDGFKQVNDSEGHRRGDDVIAAVADVLQRHAGARAAYRVGGDEFALLLPLQLADAAALCERVRIAVADLGLRVTASIGVAAYGGDQNPGDLVDAADAAMYVAKGTGRDRVVVDGSAAALVAL